MWQTPFIIIILASCIFIYLENINLILAFIINSISQPNEHLNISLAFIVCSNTEMHMILYVTVNVYTAIMISYPIRYLSGSGDRIRELSNFYFKHCVVSWNPIRNIYYCNYFFINFFSFLQYRLSILFNLICLVTTTFSRRIRNTVALILVCHLFSLQHEISNSVAF